jgi:phage repressor protein C with HTH and peptisase S24 domain
MSRRSETRKTNLTSIPQTGERAAFIVRLQAILRHWPSADRLARATGVSPSAFRKWLRGEAEPSRERLVALAQAAGVTVGWLASGEGPEPRLRATAGPSRTVSVDAGLDRRDYVLLPRRPEAAAAGPESPPPPRAVEFMALRHEWVRSEFGIEPDRLLMETAVGESMLPGIRDGDLLLVDASENRFRSFGIYVLEIAGERLVKRVQPKLDGSLTLISDNPAYEVEHVLPAQAADIHVVGRVLWTCGPPRGLR